jgi:hypothetical protein
MSSFIKFRIAPKPPVEKNKEKKSEKYNIDKINRKLKVYCVYFPQYHSFIENDTNFYPGYTDITNLQLLIKEKPSTHYLTPSLKELGLSKISDYDLVKNKNLVQNQLKILEKYNIEGFAVYYYWFSINMLSSTNMLMKTAIDNFFDDSVNMYGRKLYFIWANDNWTSNIWFGSKKHKIENKYDAESLIPNITNLLVYFKHTNYLKINNKPVLFIHHPWYFTNTELDNFRTIINAMCIDNGFAGINLAVGNATKTYADYTNYSNTAIKILPNNNDYEKYVESMKLCGDLHMINFDFDNEARMYKPFRDKLHKYANVTEKAQRAILKKTLHHYNNTPKKTDLDDLLIINAWNEWGERMSIEPSEQKGYYFLDMIKKFVTPFL